jgi:hypothetical protein
VGIIRKGMRVVSIYEPERVFVIDKSRAGKRVFHEKGAARWYTASELQPARASRKATKPLTRKRLAKVQNERSAAFLGHKKLELSAPTSQKLSCTNAGWNLRAPRSRATCAWVNGHFAAMRTAHVTGSAGMRPQRFPQFPQLNPQKLCKGERMTTPTLRHGVSGRANGAGEKSFPQIHSTHHNNKILSSS